ncbi:MAG: bifunctional UDP-sugar hydrolase/5'-nucleotidase [Bacteroidales bacterium]|nr:bifunctional UDP-sugar hydrolase/5'-nucleotidase [Bacteroidales bacterium]
MSKAYLLKTFFLLSLLLAVACQKPQADIVILYDNDPHCAVEGYACMAALKADYLDRGYEVAVTSSGDFAQGGSMGASSHGEYIVQLMNLVGYDAVTLGNHEFDYGMSQLRKLCGMLRADVVDCNLYDIQTNQRVFKPYTIKQLGHTKVAFVGVSTPDTYYSSTPTYFKDSSGRLRYGFCADSLCAVVQHSIDAAHIEGADYVVLLSHLGDDPAAGIISPQLIAGIVGCDVVLDGHAHSVIEQREIADKAGHPVILTSTGTKFANIGQLTITPQGRLTTRLVSVKESGGKDAATQACIDSLKEAFTLMSGRIVGYSKVKLRINDEHGERLVRRRETNLGDFLTDAFRTVTGADIAFMNGGSIRADIEEGAVTFKDLFEVFPFESHVCVAELTGKLLLEALEHSVSFYPEEFGGFQQVSGLRFEFDSSLKPRVRSVQVLNRQTHAFEPLNPDKTYTLAHHDYHLKKYGNGFEMFSKARIIADETMLDTDVLEQYIGHYLNDTIDAVYAQPQQRIAILNDDNRIVE